MVSLGPDTPDTTLRGDHGDQELACHIARSRSLLGLLKDKGKYPMDSFFVRILVQTSDWLEHDGNIASA